MNSSANASRAHAWPVAPRRPSAARRARPAFSIVEALVALSITALAGSVLLLAVESTVQTTTDSVQQTIADGLAQQLLDEILTRRFVSTGGDPLSTVFGPSTYENAGQGRERFNDTDDYHLIEALPAEGRWGEALGTGDDAGNLRAPDFRVPSGYLDNFRQRVAVYFVGPSDHKEPLSSGTSYFRAIEVHIDIQDPDGGFRTLATRKRIVAYVDPPG